MTQSTQTFFTCLEKILFSMNGLNIPVGGQIISHAYLEKGIYLGREKSTLNR